MGKYLLEAALHARESLFAGHFEAEDHYWMQAADGTVTKEWHANVNCAFDTQAGFHRFDYLSPDDAKQGFYLIERPDGVAFHGALSPALEITSLSKLPKLRPGRFFDVHLVGLVSPTETRGRRLADVIPFFERATSLRGRPGDVKGMFHLEMEFGSHGVMSDIHLNEQQGYTPTHFEMRYRNRETQQMEPTPRDPLDVSWERHGDVWVPTRIAWKVDFSPHPSENRLILLQWTSVNQPLPERLFDRRSIPLKPGTMVADSRLDPHHAVLIETIPNPAAATLPSHPASAPARRGMWWVLANVAVLAVVAIATFIYRRRPVR